MNTRRLLLAVLAMLLVSSFVLIAPQSAYAISTGCASINADSNHSGVTKTYSGTFEAGETVTATFSNASAATTVELRINQVAGVNTAPLAQNATVTLTHTFSSAGLFEVQARSGPGGAGGATSTMVITCAAAPVSPTPTTPVPGAPAPTPNPGAIPAAAAAQVGPGIPAGFVLRTIFCDTPLYVEPNGDPVPGGAAVKVGQTWFVAPEADEETPDWIEGFFGGKNNAWLPANCAG
jgi:hypothetical protein